MNFRLQILKFLLAIFCVQLNACSTVSTITRQFRPINKVRVNTAPYYQTFHNGVRGENAAIGHLEVKLDRRLEGSPQAKTLLKPLLDEMNRVLNTQGWTTPLSISVATDLAPDIYIGSIDGFNSPVSAATEKRTSESINDIHPPVIVYTVDPDQFWKDQLAGLLIQQPLEGVICITLGIAEFYAGQTNFYGPKKVELGTGYTVEADWITSVDQPVQALYAGGVLLDETGSVIRAGGEGIYLKSPEQNSANPDLLSRLSTADIDYLVFQQRREIAAGNLLTWQIALQNLYAQLLQKKDMLVK